MYDEKNEHEHAIVPLSEVYMDRHDMFDSIISEEKQRIKRIKMWFILLDIGFVILSIFGISAFEYFRTQVKDSSTYGYLVLDFVLWILPAIILAWSAFSITRTVKNLNGNKPNICLLLWHLINLVVAAIFESFELVMAIAVISLD